MLNRIYDRLGTRFATVVCLTFLSIFCAGCVIVTFKQKPRPFPKEEASQTTLPSGPQSSKFPESVGTHGDKLTETTLVRYLATSERCAITDKVDYRMVRCWVPAPRKRQ